MMIRPNATGLNPRTVPAHLLPSEIVSAPPSGRGRVSGRRLGRTPMPDLCLGMDAAVGENDVDERGGRNRPDPSVQS
jgi:hypothetical protein